MQALLCRDRRVRHVTTSRHHHKVTIDNVGCYNIKEQRSNKLFAFSSNICEDIRNPSYQTSLYMQWWNAGTLGNMVHKCNISRSFKKKRTNWMLTYSNVYIFDCLGLSYTICFFCMIMVFCIVISP
jgi:hypothetical protein